MAASVAHAVAWNSGVMRSFGTIFTSRTGPSSCHARGLAVEKTIVGINGGERQQKNPYRTWTGDLLPPTALSTQAFTYFQSKVGFIEGTPDDLPPARKYARSGRRSKVLVKNLR